MQMFSCHDFFSGSTVKVNVNVKLTRNYSGTWIYKTLNK